MLTRSAVSEPAIARAGLFGYRAGSGLADQRGAGARGAARRHHDKRMIPGSGGSGEFRDGLGQEIRSENESPPPIVMSFMASPPECVHHPQGRPRRAVPSYRVVAMWQPSERWIESAYPWMGGVAAWGVAVAFVPRWLLGDPARTLVDPVINIAAIAIAFLVAVAVILAPLKAEPVIREMQRIDAFPVMLGYLRSAIYIWSFALVVGLVVKVVPGEAIALGTIPVTGTFPRPTWLRVLVPLWLAALFAGGLAGHRIIRVLFALLRYRDPRLARPAPPAGDEPLRLAPERRRRAVS